MAAASAIGSEQSPAVSSNGLSYNKDGGVLAMSTNNGNINLNGKLFVDASPNSENPFSKLFSQSQVNQVV